MRVLLVDDHELIWNGTRLLLQEVLRGVDPAAVLDFRAARGLPQALALQPARFNLILLDYHLPGTGGLAALKAVQAAFDDAMVCMVSAENGAENVRRVLEAGAAGFIPKSYGEAEMAAALGLVMRGKAYVPPEFLFAEDVVRERDADEVRNEELRVFLQSELSQRQRQVLRLALLGLPNKTIGRRLDIAEGTVKVHLSMVYRALGVRNRVGALCRVLQADAAGALD
jgi:two-component system, NarL family, nitrate/nitrite response regulator NarL